MSIPTLKGSYQVRHRSPSPGHLKGPFEFLLHLFQLQPALPIPSPGTMLTGPVSPSAVRSPSWAHLSLGPVGSWLPFHPFVGFVFKYLC